MKKERIHTGHTRLKMIQAAFDLFHQQGVNATSVDEILEKSGTGKSQFYHYFNNKEGIVHAVLQHMYETLKNDQLPLKHEMDSWEDLENWFRFFITTQQTMKCERGCPVGTIGNDLSNSQDLLRQDVRLIFDLSRHFLSRCFSSLKAKGEIPATVDPDALADFCYVIIQGGLLVAKIQRESAPFENAVSHALAYFKSFKTS